MTVYEERYSANTADMITDLFADMTAEIATHITPGRKVLDTTEKPVASRWRETRRPVQAISSPLVLSPRERTPSSPVCPEGLVVVVSASLSAPHVRRHAAAVASASTWAPFMRTDTTLDTPGSCIVTP